MKCDELKAFDVGLGQYSEDGSPCVVAFDADRNPRLLNEKVYLKSDVDAAIAELKQKLQDQCISCPVKMQEDDVVAELKQELEDAKASAYADSVDAGMENRGLKRALWLSRAERADDRARIFYFNDLETKLDIDGFSYDSKKKKGHKKLTARDWRITWLKVERKCRAKAEEYK